jgi:cytochrome c oxidase cbb3-type subunit 2
VAFREYKIGARLFGVALGGSMLITLYFPTVNMTSVAATEIGLRKGLSFGRVSGFSYQDPFLQGKNMPKTVLLKKDPSTGAPIDPPIYAYVYEPGIPMPGAVQHPRTLGPGVKELSVEKGRITEATSAAGAVFVVTQEDYGSHHATGGEHPTEVLHEALSGEEPTAYIEDATATRGWTPAQVLATAGDANTMYVGSGKNMFIREGCWWCHTLLPEETQDWQAFGVPPRLGDFNDESPTAFGSDRKAPDLLHVGSRNSSKEWMMMHFFNPRLVQPHSIMPRFDYLWGKVDANGKPIDFAGWRKEFTEYQEGKRIYPPDIPQYASNSDIRYLIDFVLNLK